MRSFLLGTVAIVISALHASPAEACSCAAARIDDMARSFDVVVFATVGVARPEADGMMSSPIVVHDLVRGPTKAPPRVYWAKPDGRSCFMTDLRAGEWLLFLSWMPDGRLVVGRCDQHSQRIPDAAKRAQTRKALVGALLPVHTAAEAADAAARAVRRMLVASMAGKAGTELAPAPPGLDLALPERALVSAEADGSFVVRWSVNPPAGHSVDAEVRVFADGVTQVVRADAAFSPD